MLVKKYPVYRSGKSHLVYLVNRSHPVDLVDLIHYIWGILLIKDKFYLLWSTIRYMWQNEYFCIYEQAITSTGTPFKFAAVKLRGFDIMTYSLPFNFAVSYQNYFMVSYLPTSLTTFNMIKIIWILVPEENAKRHPHEHINTKKIICLKTKFSSKKKINNSRPFNFANCRLAKLMAREN